MLDLALADQELIEITINLANACMAALQRGNKILLAGNGGSAADAQHLSAELVSRFNFDRPGLAAFALTTNTSVLTAVGNDYGYELVFARQIEAIGQAGDIFIGISTSGRSRNVLKALEEARKKNLITAAFTGMNSGEMASRSDYVIRMPSRETPKIQEGHIVFGHILCGLIERGMFAGD
jgi:D-sedoheptulose 7-phosphate isomerase